MKIIILVMWLTLLIIISAGCSFVPAAPENAAMQLESFNWIKTDEGDGELGFSDGSFRLVDNKSGLSLKGRYEADENALTLYTEDCGTIVLPYTIEGEKLALCYREKEIYFTKIDM